MSRKKGIFSLDRFSPVVGFIALSLSRLLVKELGQLWEMDPGARREFQQSGALERLSSADRDVSVREEAGRAPATLGHRSQCPSSRGTDGFVTARGLVVTSRRGSELRTSIDSSSLGMDRSEATRESRPPSGSWTTADELGKLATFGVVGVKRACNGRPGDSSDFSGKSRSDGSGREEEKWVL